jgi:hypothetical protein
MTTQARFTRGKETRKQPDRQRSDFELLLECERRHERLLEELDVKLTPAVAAEVKRHPKRYMAKYPASDLAMSIDSIQMVSNVNYHL